MGITWESHVTFTFPDPCFLVEIVPFLSEYENSYAIRMRKNLTACDNHLIACENHLITCENYLTASDKMCSQCAPHAICCFSHVTRQKFGYEKKRSRFGKSHTEYNFPDTVKKNTNVENHRRHGCEIVSPTDDVIDFGVIRIIKIMIFIILMILGKFTQ